jgi:hypothetical protein
MSPMSYLTAPPRDRKDMLTLPGGSLERETGLEPATLSLEG